MDKYFRLGKLLILNRIILFLGVYFLTSIRPLTNFLHTFGVRWDGNSYTFIATHGYVLTGPEKNFLVFPPFYPILIKSLTFLGIDSVFAGVIISNIFFIAGMLFLYKLLTLDFGEKLAFWTVIIISIFPTSYFFSVAYPESLFVFLFVLSFYLAKKRMYFYSGLIGGLAAITRPFGVMLAPMILMQLILNKDLNIKNFFLLAVSFSISPAYYLLINYLLFGNPFEFLTFLKANWQKSFDYPWNGIIASWKRGFYSTDFIYKYFVGYGEAIASTAAWISVAIGLKKWGIKSPYFIYLTLTTIFFTSTSFILSAPRYLLSIPPFFILLAGTISKNKLLIIVWSATSVFLLFYVAKVFATGQWAF